MSLVPRPMSEASEHQSEQGAVSNCVRWKLCSSTTHYAQEHMADLVYASLGIASRKFVRTGSLGFATKSWCPQGAWGFAVTQCACREPMTQLLRQLGTFELPVAVLQCCGECGQLLVIGCAFQSTPSPCLHPGCPFQVQLSECCAVTAFPCMVQAIALS